MKSLLVISLVAFLSSSAYAKPAYLVKFKKAYPSAKSLQDCTTCHDMKASEDYKIRNDYGKDYEHNNHDFKAIEGHDSDADGFTNIAEINAGTEPGNKDSHPAH